MKDPLNVRIHHPLRLQGFQLWKDSLPESGIRYWESPRPSRTFVSFQKNISKVL